MADAHPRWMASLGMHDDWRTRFPKAKAPSKEEVTKAYPWVPVAYVEAFEAHVRRVERLLQLVPAGYRGILLNDLQGGPASCGCGNLQCRWAIDYGVPQTAAKQGVDDAAARFVAAVRELAPDKQIVPVWMTECEEVDLPADKSPTGKTTGLCGSVACAQGTCPRAFAEQLRALLDSHTGPLGLLVAEDASGRDVTSYGGPGGWVTAAVGYLDGARLNAAARVPHHRLWLVVQGAPENSAPEAASRRAAQRLGPGMVIVARIQIEQSYEPRVIAVGPQSN